MKDRVATRTAYRRGAWNCAVMAVLSGVGAIFEGPLVFKLIWIGVGLLALVVGILTFIKSRSAEDS